MKKRFLLYALILGVVLIVLLNVKTVSSELVCGHAPDSLSGYGQVQPYAGVNYSCDNVADGFCPEDYETFNNSNIWGDCSNCHDPDCTGNVSGRVDSFDGGPISRATVKALPLRYNLTAPSLERMNITTTTGTFSLANVTTGTYYFSASQEGFDTELIEVKVLRKKKTTGVNFTLANGTCFDDCTNSYGRCNAQCDGLSFNNGATQCKFYSSQTASLCDNRLKGTEVIIPGTFNTTHAQFVNCCEAAPVWRYYQTAEIKTSSIKNLAKIEKVVKYNDQPVRLVIAYWPNLE